MSDATDERRDPRDAEDETLLQEASQAIESRLAGWHDPAILGLITSLCASLATARDEALEEAAQAIELPMTPMTIMDMETLEAAAATIRALKTKGAGDE